MFLKLLKLNDHNFIIEDSNFTIEIMGVTGSVSAVIRAYEQQAYPVAPNLARYYISLMDDDYYYPTTTSLFQRIEQDGKFFAQWRPKLNYTKYQKCVINQIKKIEYVGK